MEYKKEAVLIVGEDKMAFSITVCLLDAGHKVILYSKKKADALECINTHFSDMYEQQFDVLARDNFDITDHLGNEINCRLAIVITNENLSHKRSVIKQLEDVLSQNALIAINTECIPLSAIHKETVRPERIIGANWVEPAHTTFFLEIISNKKNHKEQLYDFYTTAKLFWNKDPYLLKKDVGIRARMMSAMIREAFYLVENGYVSIEDIDRACRNDAGYYLPFAGNCRYMDLMGTYGYGEVMRELNPDLSKDRSIPAFFMKIIDEGGKGMENGHGLYDYQNGEVNKFYKLFRRFSYQIQQIISRYSFNYAGESPFVEQKNK